MRLIGIFPNLKGCWLAQRCFLWLLLLFIDILYVVMSCILCLLNYCYRLMDMENNIINNLSKWLHWFVGFTDAEGNFQVYPKKRVLKSGDISKINVGYSYHLSLHKRDLDLLKYVQRELKGIGSIYIYADKSDVRLAINDKKSLLYLIHNVFDLCPLITKNQTIRYNLLRSGLKDEIKEFTNLESYNTYIRDSTTFITDKLNNICDENRIKGVLNNVCVNNWVVGFINGEGCFYLNKGRPNFCIEHTDKISLDIIKRVLLFGPNVYERSPRERDKDKTRKTTYRLIVSSKNDIANLIVFLDDKTNMRLQGNKYVQYSEWKQHK